MRRSIPFIVGGLVLLALLAWLALRGEDAGSSQRVLANHAEPQGQVAAGLEPASSERGSAQPARERDAVDDASGSMKSTPVRPGSARPITVPLARDGERAQGGGEEAPGDQSAKATSADVPREPERRGTIDRVAIRDGIEAVKPEIRDCFQEALRHDPSLAGRIVVEFEIEASNGQGTITRGEVVDSETRSPFFEACVLTRVAGAGFPAPEGDGTVKVRYPFHFDPGGGFGGAPTD